VPFDVLAEVLSNRPLSPDYNVVGFAAPEIAEHTRPGQFVMVKTTDSGDPMLRRPFSVFEILRDANRRPIGVSVLNKRVGVGTARLYDARPGDHLSILGPLGQPFPVQPVQPDQPVEAFLVAGGVGLAPFWTMAETLAAAKTPTTLFYGGRRASDLYYEDFFTALGITLVLTTEDGSRGEKGRITAPLERALADRAPGSAALYVCGPTPMMRAVATIGAARACPTYVSLEPVMGCGMGGCYSCVIPVRENGRAHFVRSCIEGPVFDASRVVWEGLGHH
jgi:dihydroorotate dehydrogenase electron transfer subunit